MVNTFETNSTNNSSASLNNRLSTHQDYSDHVCCQSPEPKLNLVEPAGNVKKAIINLTALERPLKYFTNTDEGIKPLII